MFDGPARERTVRSQIQKGRRTRTHDVHTALVQIGREGQAGQTRVAAVGAAIDTHVLRVRYLLVDGPLHGVREVVLHGADAPLLVSFMQEGLAVARAPSIVHL